MKRIIGLTAGTFLLCCFGFAVGCPSAPPGTVLGNVLHMRFQTNAAGDPVSILWDYDFTTPNDKACSATVTTSCVSGFQEAVFNSKPAQVAGPVNVPLPATISSTGPTTGISTPFNVPTSLDTYQIQVSIAWKDGTGAQQFGPSAGLAFPRIPNAVGNLRAQ